MLTCFSHLLCWGWIWTRVWNQHAKLKKGMFLTGSSFPTKGLSSSFSLLTTCRFNKETVYDSWGFSVTYSLFAPQVFNIQCFHSIISKPMSLVSGSNKCPFYIILLHFRNPMDKVNFINMILNQFRPSWNTSIQNGFEKQL